MPQTARERSWRCGTAELEAVWSNSYRMDWLPCKLRASAGIPRGLPQLTAVLALELRDPIELPSLRLRAAGHRL